MIDSNQSNTSNKQQKQYYLHFYSVDTPLDTPEIALKTVT